MTSDQMTFKGHISMQEALNRTYWLLWAKNVAYCPLNHLIDQKLCLSEVLFKVSWGHICSQSIDKL